MSIQEIMTNIKRFFENRDSFLAMVLVVVSVASFGLGRASMVDFGPKNDTNVGAISVSMIQAESISEVEVHEATITQDIEKPDLNASSAGQYVASKNGTKYHLPWCVGAKQIKEENKVWFNSKAEAEKAGYTPAGNCKGI